MLNYIIRLYHLKKKKKKIFQTISDLILLHDSCHPDLEPLHDSCHAKWQPHYSTMPFKRKKNKKFPNVLTSNLVKAPKSVPYSMLRSPAPPAVDRYTYFDVLVVDISTDTTGYQLQYLEQGGWWSEWKKGATCSASRRSSEEKEDGEDGEIRSEVTASEWNSPTPEFGLKSFGSLSCFCFEKVPQPPSYAFYGAGRC